MTSSRAGEFPADAAVAAGGCAIRAGDSSYFDGAGGGIDAAGDFHGEPHCNPLPLEAIFVQTKPCRQKRPLPAAVVLDLT